MHETTRTFTAANAYAIRAGIENPMTQSGHVAQKVNRPLAMQTTWALKKLYPM